MQEIKCFEVTGHTDTTEGRGPKKVVARFSNKAAAEKYVNSPLYARWCVMGYQFKDDALYNIREQIITVLDSVDELDEMRKQEVKQKALNKLTVEERQVLGLE